jgi:hypothetical protein
LTKQRITCDWCGLQPSHFVGYYCADTPRLGSAPSEEEIAARNAGRVWLCYECRSNVLAEIFRTRARASWQTILDAAGRGPGVGDGAMVEAEEKKETDG